MERNKSRANRTEIHIKILPHSTVYQAPFPAAYFPAVLSQSRIQQMYNSILRRSSKSSPVTHRQRALSVHLGLIGSLLD